MKKLLIGIYILIIVGIVFIINNNSLKDKKNDKAINAGEKIYKQQCFVCHGDTGKGEGAKAGTAINNQHFLSSVSNKDLYNYVKFGREGTAMPSYQGKVSENDLKNLVAYMRGWQNEDLNLKAPTAISGDPENGKKIYGLYCMSCHWGNGAGREKMGTVLSNPQYLKYTTDRQIWIGTAYGREDTRMGPSLKGEEGVRQLKEKDISDVVSYIRSLQSK
ncbi:cytochrome c [Neobacillus terrae]|uniref:cytochrome c n=1 Tax=Neobacillus terrae TaxID=3034837 RepID=UPI0014075ABE|nr:c-type cytochrome [Neobacillus terrae]NHM32215.1 c-type cytochrome [Neobacillus terrae]